MLIALALLVQSELVVVAPDAFHPALADFVAHKRKRIATELASLESILKGEGTDDPEKLKRWLFGRWKKGARYALLVGDGDVLPVRYMVLDRVTPAAFDYAFYPSDLYYADLAKPDGSFDDWNAARDGFHARYWGEVRGEKNKKDPINFDAIDYRPDIAVGRWPVSTVDELRVVAAKTIAHESAKRERRAAFVHVGGWVDARATVGALAKKLGGAERFYDTKTPPSEPDTVAMMNEGLTLLFHAGHGSESVWEGALSTDSIARLKNADRLPVLFSAGCSTAYFAPLPPYEGYADVDGKEHAGSNHGEVFKEPPPPPAPYQRGKHNRTGLGERMLKQGPAGAVAYIGCNTGSQPCALSLMEGFVQAIAEAKEAIRLGDAWSRAVAFYWDKERLAELKPNDDWYPPSVFFQGMKFMLFGDPSLELEGTR